MDSPDCEGGLHWLQFPSSRSLIGTDERNNDLSSAPEHRCLLSSTSCTVPSFLRVPMVTKAVARSSFRLVLHSGGPFYVRSDNGRSLSRPLRRRRRHYFVDNAPRGLVAKKAFSGNLSVCPRQQSCLLARPLPSSFFRSLAPSPPSLLSSSVHFFGRFRCHPPSSGPEAVSPSVGRPTGPSRSPLCPVPDTYGCELASGRSGRKEEGSG